MGDVTAVLLDGRLLLAGTTLVLVDVAAGAWLARRLRVTRAHAFALVVATGAVLAVTLVNRTSDQLDIARLLRWEPERWLEFGRVDWVLNVGLFVPAAALWTAAVRRPLPVIACAAVLSVLIEAAQSTFRLGTGDQADLVANTLGAIAGATIGWAWARRGPSATTGEAAAHWTRRQLVGAVAVGLVAALTAVAGIGAAADQLTDDVVASLSSTLGDATGDDLAAILRLPDAQALTYFRTPLDVGADAIVRSPGGDRVVIRYPIDFLGAQRCVFADIGPSGTVLRTAARNACALPPADTGNGRAAPATAAVARRAPAIAPRAG